MADSDSERGVRPSSDGARKYSEGGKEGKENRRKGKFYWGHLKDILPDSYGEVKGTEKSN